MLGSKHWRMGGWRRRRAGRPHARGDLPGRHRRPRHPAVAGRLRGLPGLPRVTFTDPEVGAVGRTESEAREEGRTVVTGTALVPSSARGWLHKAGNDGFIELVVDAETDLLVGATSVGPAGGEVLSALAVAAPPGPGLRAGADDLPLPDESPRPSAAASVSSSRSSPTPSSSPYPNASPEPSSPSPLPPPSDPSHGGPRSSSPTNSLPPSPRPPERPPPRSSASSPNRDSSASAAAGSPSSVGTA